MRALIVGAGEMGTWFAEVTREWLEMSFLDADPSRAERVAERYDADHKAPESIDRFDVVVTAVPMDATEESIAEYGPLADRAVIDVSGEMGGPMEAMRETAPKVERLSLHPLFAPENAPGNIPIVSENEGPIKARLIELLEAAGYNPFETTAEVHDRAMENVQAKVHAAVLAYALAAEPVDPRFHTPVSAGMSDLLDFVLHGNPRVYSDIQSRYAGAEDVADAATRLAAVSTADAFEALYDEASQRQLERG